MWITNSYFCSVLPKQRCEDEEKNIEEKKTQNWQVYLCKIVHIRLRETENYAPLTKCAHRMKLSASDDSNQKSPLTSPV